jgi:hypothetical protein
MTSGSAQTGNNKTVCVVNDTQVRFFRHRSGARGQWSFFQHAELLVKAQFSIFGTGIADT